MEKLKIHGLTFTRLDCCDCGDYGGAGDIGVANLRVLKDQFSDRMHDFRQYEFDHKGEYKESCYRSITNINTEELQGVDLIILTDHYGSESAYLREPNDDDECDDDYRAEYDDIVRGLANYPALDDDEVYRVRQEWLEEALTDIARYTVRGLSKHDISEDYTLQDVWDAMDQEQCLAIVREAYKKASENYDIAAYEYNGAYVDEDKIIPFIVQSLAGTWHDGYKLQDGTMIDLGPVSTEPDPFPKTWKNTADYVAQYCALNHLTMGA